MEMPEINAFLLAKEEKVASVVCLWSLDMEPLAVVWVMMAVVVKYCPLKEEVELDV